MADKSAKPTNQTQSRDETQAYLELLRQALDVSVSILDEDLKYKFISDSTYSLLNINKADLNIGDPLEACHKLMIENGMLDPDFIEKNQLSADDQRKRAASKTEAVASLMELGDGSTQRFVRKVMDNGYTVSMSTDVSELVEKDKMLEDALRLGHAGYWILDLATQSLTLSESLKDDFSDEDLAIIARDGILALVHEEDRAILWHALTKITADDPIISTTVRITPRDGKARWHQVDAELMQDQEGQWNRVRAFVRDVTKYRIQAEALEAATNQAIAASKAKSQFLANMSHEIRTPLNGVMGMAELLSRTDIDSRQKDFVDIITQSATQLLMIINDILDFSRVEAGEMRIDAAPLDLNKTINDVASLVGPLARDKGLELIVNYPQDVPRNFMGDLGRIRQILTNLIGNAVKFTDNGYISVDVKVSEGNDSTGIVILDVTDTGMGIPDDKLGTIFSKFTQVDNSTTRVHGGTGLGLSISKNLVELMRGKITVKSELGQGSKFSVYLPLPYDINAEADTIEPIVVEGKRALIVDDIDINRRILSETLNAWGMICVTAPDAFAAMETLKNSQDGNTDFDLIVSDHLMPGMNGQEFAAAISANKSFSDIPIVMLSSCDRVLSKEELRAVGIDEYLVKPASSERLFKAITKVMSQSLPANAPEKAYDDTLMETVFGGGEQAAPCRYKVLVAEDLVLNQDVVGMMLDDTPFDPIFVENGKEAFDMYCAETGQFAAVLMDISMPVMDGKEATQRIRAFETEAILPETPVIALTGHALKEDRQKFLDAGLDDYLSKPVKRGDLLRMLEKWTAKSKEEQQAVA